MIIIKSANWKAHTVTISHNYILLLNACRAASVNWSDPVSFFFQRLSLEALTTSCVSSDKLCKDMAPGDWLNNPLNPLSQPTSSLHPTSRANLHISSYSLCFVFCSVFFSHGSVNLCSVHVTAKDSFHD